MTRPSKDLVDGAIDASQTELGKAYREARAECERLRVQLDGSFGGVSRNQIFAMGRREAETQPRELREELAHAHDKLVGAESELREDLAEESLGKAAVATGSGTFSVSLFDLLETSAAALARAEALPAQWREKASRPQSPLFTNAEHALTTFTFEGCADELEAALKGGE